MTTFIYVMKHSILTRLERNTIKHAILDAIDAKNGLEELGSRYHGMSQKLEAPIEHINTLIGRLEKLEADTKGE